MTRGQFKKIAEIQARTRHKFDSKVDTPESFITRYDTKTVKAFNYPEAFLRHRDFFKYHAD